jgi:hypothetical protein
MDRVEVPRDPSRVRPDPTRWLPVTALACVLAGCLPAGDSPAGRHLVHDRTLSAVFLSPSEQAGVPSHVLAAGPVFHPALAPPDAYDLLADIYRFPDASPVTTAEGLAEMVPVLEDLYFPSTEPTKYTFATDALGRLLYMKLDASVPAGEANPYMLCRHDRTAAADECFLRPNLTYSLYGKTNPRLRTQPFLLSPAQTQVYASYGGSGWVIGLDGGHFLDHAINAGFVGEDFYCTGSEGTEIESSGWGWNVIRIRPGAEPEMLASSTAEWGIVGVVAAPVPQLVLANYTDKGWAAFGMLDTETLAIRTFPTDKGDAEFVSSSPNGQFMLFRTPVTVGTPTAPTEYRFFIFDWGAKHTIPIDSSVVGLGPSGDSEWRPGTSELWFWTLPVGFAIWSPERSGRVIIGNLYRHRPALGEASAFTADGRHWFSQGSEPRPRIHVGSADDPTAPLVPLHPEGTVNDRYWLLDDGRLLVEAWASHQDRNDIYLVDADAGTSLALGSAGRVVTVGRDRALTLLNWIVSRSSGELTLVDYAGSARTLLAADVYAADVDRGQSANVAPGSDALAPGTRVAFLSRNRLPSRDDGLWVMELP